VCKYQLLLSWTKKIVVVDSTVTELTRRIAAMESQSIANKSAFVDQNFQEGFVARLEEIEAKYAAEQKEKDVLVAR
jgi:hypothetical protein